MDKLKYAKIENGEVVKYPYSIEDLRKDNPNVSFPSIVDEVIKSAYSMLPVQKVEVQSDYTKNVSENLPELVDNVWTQSWNVVDATEEEVNQRLVTKWQEVRDERGGRLSSSDWTQLPDSPLTEEQKNSWKQYRQELRDITNQANPFEIIFPEKP